MTFDRYRLAAKLSAAIDTVRRAEVTTRPELKHTRFATLVEKHWDGIITWHANHLSNGLLEGINT